MSRDAGEAVATLNAEPGRDILCSVGKVDADFLSGPSPTAPFLGPSRELAAEKDRFASARRRRWFGR